MTARIVALPGVYRPRSDTALLARALAHHAGPLQGRDVLDLCTGTGALAVAAARAGARVHAVDVSRRAVLNVRLNARLNGRTVRVHRGDLWDAVRGRRFDLIVSNPPYLPAPAAARGAARAWDAGHDGRLLLDPICRGACDHLRPGGRLLLVQSALADAEKSARQLDAAGLRTRVIRRHEGALGPIVAGRAAWLRASGRLAGDREALIVLEAVLEGAQDQQRDVVGRHPAMQLD